MKNGLSELNGSGTETDTKQQRTNIEFEDPLHPAMDATYTTDEDAIAYYEAAVGAKSWPGNRKVLVGEFLVAVEELHIEGDSDRLIGMMETITGQPVSVGSDD